MEPEQRTAARPLRSWLETLSLFLFLFGFWVVLSGRFEIQTLAIGALCVAVVTAITPDRFLLAGRAHPRFGLDAGKISLLGTVRYGAWLLWAIVLANLQVAYLVLHPKMPVDPKLIRFSTDLESWVARVVLAHSITLTPGTVTVDVDEEGSYLVHVLVPHFAEPLLEARTQNGIAATVGEPTQRKPAVEWMESVRETGEVVEEGPGSPGSALADGAGRDGAG